MTNETDAAHFKDVDAVRLRPAMYIGCADTGGLHNLLNEALAFYLEGAIRGSLGRIEITFHLDGSCSLGCDGQGLPRPEACADGTPGLIAACTQRPLRGGDPERWGSGRLCFLGCGLVALNALAEWLELSVRRGETVWSQRFERGYPVEALAAFGPGAKGSSLRWLPDAEIFGGATWRLSILRDRLQTLAYLVPSAHLILVDEQSGGSWQFHQPDGLRELVERLNSARIVLHPPLCLELNGSWGAATVGLQYHSIRGCGDNCSGEVLSFANLRSTDGGVHVTALARALTEALNHFARRNRLLAPDAPNLTWPVVRMCLRAVISVFVDDVQWQGSMRQELGDSELGEQLEAALRIEFERAFAADEPTWHALVKSIVWHAEFRPKRERALRLKRGRAPERGSLP